MASRPRLTIAAELATILVLPVTAYGWLESTKRLPDALILPERLSVAPSTWAFAAGALVAVAILLGLGRLRGIEQAYEAQRIELHTLEGRLLQSINETGSVINQRVGAVEDRLQKTVEFVTGADGLSRANARLEVYGARLDQVEDRLAKIAPTLGDIAKQALKAPPDK